MAPLVPTSPISPRTARRLWALQYHPYWVDNVSVLNIPQISTFHYSLHTQGINKYSVIISFYRCPWLLIPLHIFSFFFITFIFLLSCRLFFFCFSASYKSASTKIQNTFRDDTYLHALGKLSTKLLLFHLTLDSYLIIYLFGYNFLISVFFFNYYFYYLTNSYY